MALQDFEVHLDGDQLNRKLTQPASGGVAGAPGLVGDRPCVLLTDQDANGYATVRFVGTYLFTVEGVDGSGNSAVAINDALYYDAAATIKINKDSANGVRFGSAFGAVTSAGNGAIEVDIHR